MTIVASALLRRLGTPAAVGVTLLVQTLVSLLTASVPVIAPAIASDRGWNVEVVALYPPIVYIAAFLISFKIPDLLRLFGGMGLGLTCVAVSAIGVSCLLPPFLVLSVAAPLAIGCGYGAMTPASSQMLGPRVTPRTVGLLMSIKQTGVPLGAVLAGIILPTLVLRSGWDAAVIQLIVTSLAITVALLPARRWLNGAALPAPPFATRPSGPVVHLWGMPGFPTLLLATLIFTGMQLCLRTFFTVYLMRDLGFGPPMAGVAFSVSQAAGIVGLVGWAAISDRVLTPHAVMAFVGVLMTIAAASTATLGPGSPIAIVLSVALLFGASAHGFIPVVLGEVARRSPPGEVGALTSGVNLFVITGALTGPLVFGGVGAILGYPAAFLLLAASALVGAILVLPRLLRTNIRIPEPGTIPDPQSPLQSESAHQ